MKRKVAARGDLISEHRLIGGVTARLASTDIAGLAADSDVESISGDHEVNAFAKRTASTTPGLVAQTLGLGDWFTGASVAVALVDSGISPSADFGNRIKGFYDFSYGRRGARVSPYDDFGHGTHVAGLIGSSGASSGGKYAGVAPAVNFVALKVLDRHGVGRTSDVISALEFVVANRDYLGIKIVNVSLGHPIYESARTDPLVNAIEAAVRAGLVVVVAAGNYGNNPATGEAGYAGIASPGNSPSAITVGAAATNNTVVRTDDRVATFSSRGPSWVDGFAKPDVLAPGQGLVSNVAPGSTLESGYPGLVVTAGGSKFLKLSGSSMGAGVVSGLIAVMLEASQYAGEQRWQEYQSTLPRKQRTSYGGVPRLGTNAIKAMLQYTATPLRDELGRAYGPLEQGTGLVNGHGSVALAYYTDTSRPVGGYWLTSTIPPTTRFGGLETSWSEHLIWGTRLLAGGSLVEIKQMAWEEDNIVWGTGEMDHVVWGTYSAEEDNIVWGTMIGEEDNIVWGTSCDPTLDLAWAGNAAFDEDDLVWGTGVAWEDNIVWGTALVGFYDGFNIVWGTLSGEEDNIVWGTLEEDNIVWGTSAGKVLAILVSADSGG